MSQTSRGTLAESLNANELAEDEYYEVLAAEERRIALDVLSHDASAVELDELAALVTAESSDDVALDRMRATLHHTHLPKMAAHGVIEYDPETCLVHSPQTTS
jgi:hypothetical protein